MDPTNLWLTIHESIGHATELDRSLGYEANYAGTSFATFDRLGSLKYGSPLMHVTGDRTVEHGLATVGWDDEGVAGQQFDLVRDGILVGFQLDRAMAQLKGLGRSNGCAYADSALHVPIQRMANVSLQPVADGPDLDGLIGGVEDGLYVVGDKSWSIDMQRYNFQFTGQRFYRIKSGRLAGQVKDAAYQANTTDFWGSMSAVGGPSTYYLGGAFNCGKGQPGQTAAVTHGCPVARFDQVNILNTLQEARAMTAVRPQDLVERALSLSRTDGCVVVAHETSTVNLRFAGSTLTTNGEMRGRSITVVATVDGAEGTASGVLSRSNVRLDQIEDIVRAAEAAARAGGPAQDARPLVTPDQAAPSVGWDDPPEITTSTVLGSFAPALGAVFRQARDADVELFGYAEHDLSTAYLATSTGVRLRHAQPAGRVEITGKSHARTRSTYVGHATRDFTDVDVPEMYAQVLRRLGWMERTIAVEPGRHDAILPPTAVGDLIVALYWSASAREAYDGRTVFSRAGGGTRVGEVLGAVPVEIYSDPADPRVGCEPFVLATASGSASSVFDNGLPLQRTSWVDEGRLAALLQTRASADLTGLPLTPGIDNLLMQVPGGAGSIDDVVASVRGRALLLTCLWYIRDVDPQTLLLTGLTRDGVHVVEDGEVIGTATNFRFNESPVDLLGRIRSAGAPQGCLPREWGDYFTRAVMPPLLVDGFNMSTVSPAS